MFKVEIGRGGSGIPLVFIHGYMMHSGMWKQILTSVPQTFPVYVVSLPGHFAPYTAAPAAAMDELALALSRALSDTSHTRFHLVGHSMGGYLAASLSRVNPDTVASLCFFHSSAQADSREKKRNRDRAIEAIAYNKALFCKSMMASLFIPGHTETLAPAIAEAIGDALNIGEETLVNLMLAMRNRRDSLAVLSTCDIPVAYITGDNDSRFPVDSQKQEAEIAKARQFSVLKNAAHMGHLEQPEATEKAFADWFKKI